MKKGIYQHYKGKYYLVITEATLEETLAPMIVYQALYDEYTLWIRSQEDFLSHVTSEKLGYSGPRFLYIRDWTGQDAKNHPKRLSSL